MRLVRNIFTWVKQTLLFYFIVFHGYIAHLGEIELQEIVNCLINTQMYNKN